MAKTPDVGDKPALPVVPDLELWRALSAQVAEFIQPGATAAKLVVESPDVEPAVIPVPLMPSFDGMEREVIDFVAKFGGDWVKGSSIADAIGMEQDGGQFRKLMASLAKPTGPLESSNRFGYRSRRKRLASSAE